MEIIYKTYNETLYKLSTLEENFHLVAYSALCFLAPFMIGHPQLVVGTVVNAALILAATYLPGHKLLPVITIPSLGVLSRGLVFGPYTAFLAYMIPFIWVGNAILCYTYKYVSQKGHYKALGIGAGAALKTAFLFSSAYVLVSAGALPPLFLTTMGLLQLYTAALGGAVALAVIKARSLKA